MSDAPLTVKYYEFYQNFIIVSIPLVHSFAHNFTFYPDPPPAIAAFVSAMAAAGYIASADNKITYTL